MRAWAREQGISVAERGRLPAELRDAYAAAQAAGGGPATAARATREAPAAKTVQRRAGTSAKAPAKAPAKGPAASSGKAPARSPAAKSPAATSAAGAKAATARTAVVSEPGPRARPAAAEVPEKATDRAPAALPAAPPAPADDTRLVRLEAALAALTARVTELEKPRPEKPALFRRKKG